MALGPCFWVFWICGLSLAEKGFGYGQMITSKTLDGEDEITTPAASDSEKWPISYSKETNPGSTRFSQISKAYRFGSVPDYSEMSLAPNVHQEKFDEPLSFPLNPTYQPRNQAEAQVPLNSPPTKLHDLSPNNYGAPHANLLTHSSSPLSFGSWGAQMPPSTSYQQREPVTYDQVPSGFVFYSPDLNIPSTVSGNLMNSLPAYDASRTSHKTNYMSEPHYAIGTAENFDKVKKLIYGPTHSYPPLFEKPSSRHYSTALEAASTLSNIKSPDSHGSSGRKYLTSRQHYADQMAHQLHDGKIASWLQHAPASSTQHTEILQEEGEPLAQPPSHIVQSRNSYQRGRVLFTKTRYSPEQPDIKKPRNLAPITSQ